MTFMRIAARPKVIIRRCPEYDVERIRTLAREALEELDLRPSGRTLVKPNCVASGDAFPHAYTRPEFLEGILGRSIKFGYSDQLTNDGLHFCGAWPKGRVSPLRHVAESAR